MFQSLYIFKASKIHPFHIFILGTVLIKLRKNTLLLF